MIYSEGRPKLSLLLLLLLYYSIALNPDSMLCNNIGKHFIVVYSFQQLNNNLIEYILLREIRSARANH